LQIVERRFDDSEIARDFGGFARADWRIVELLADWLPEKCNL
jgi:hypothetical protein